MSSAASMDRVQRVLAEAAERAQRHAELNGAHATLERVLNMTLPVETLPWGEASSMSYFATLSALLLKYHVH